MYKFYAAQDSRKDVTSFDLELLHKTLSFKEVIRFGYQQNITPNYITPEDMVHIYKNLVREMTDLDKQNLDPDHKLSGMIDYEAFKKALVRIACLAQEKLGIDDEDRLARKLQNDQANREEKEK